MRRTHIDYLLQAHSDTLKMLAEAEYEIYDARGTGDYVQARLDGQIQANAMFVTFRLMLARLLMSLQSETKIEDVGFVMRFPLPYPELQTRERITPR